MYSIDRIFWLLPIHCVYSMLVLEDDARDICTPISWDELQRLLEDDYWTTQVKLENIIYLKENVLGLVFKRRGHVEIKK